LSHGVTRSSVEPEPGVGAATQLTTEFGPESLRVADGAGRPGADLGAAVRLQQQSLEGQPVTVEFGQSGDRCPARAVEGGEHGALGRDAGGTSRIVKRLEETSQFVVCAAG